jgi:hypothetical protein
MPDLFNNDLIVYMNSAIYSLAGAIAILLTKLDRVITTIVYLLDKQELLLTEFTEIPRNTDAGMHHDSSGGIHIFLIRNYQLNGSFTFSNISDEELNNLITRKGAFYMNDA